MKYLILIAAAAVALVGWRLAAPSLATAQLIDAARHDILAQHDAPAKVRFRNLNAWRDTVCGEIGAPLPHGGQAGFARFLWTRDTGLRLGPNAGARPRADLLQSHIESQWREDYDRCQAQDS